MEWFLDFFAYGKNSDLKLNCMIDFAPILEFSRYNCTAICAFLVPANVLATIQTLVFLYLRRPLSQIWLASLFACSFAFAMFLHVATWLIIGVVMAPTFILLGLVATCLVVNLVVIIYPEKLRGILQLVVQRVHRYLLLFLNNPVKTKGLFGLQNR